MRRAKFPAGLRLAKLAYNPSSSLYEIEEEGITYGMEIEEMRELKEYFSGASSSSLIDWYKQLRKDTKKKITRTGHRQFDDYNGFFPDEY